MVFVNEEVYEVAEKHISEFMYENVEFDAIPQRSKANTFVQMYDLPDVVYMMIYELIQINNELKLAALDKKTQELKGVWRETFNTLARHNAAVFYC